MKIVYVMVGVFTVAGLIFLGSAFDAVAAEKKPVMATAEIEGCADPDISGMATLREQRTEEGIKQVQITMMVKGLSPGKHAVHIHEAGDCTPCAAAQGHFDPGPFGNSNPDGNHPFHSGDLINIKVQTKGIGSLNTTTSRVTLSDGPLSIFDDDGSAFIIHVSPDTYCPDGVVAGCAGGARAACGLIELED